MKVALRGWVNLSPHKDQAKIHRLNRLLTARVSMFISGMEN